MSSAVTNNFTTGENQHPLESFFGPYRGSHESMSADQQLSHETYNLPKSYEGKNKFLEEVLDFKIRKEDEFYTARLLPWQATDDLHVKWEIFSFDRTLVDLEPHQGVPRYVTASTESHSDNLLRRGLAFVIEHGFYKTARGKRHFNLNLAQITDAVHTTCYFGVIHALLQGQNFYKEWNRKFGRQVARHNDLMQMERRRWGIVQKSPNGLYLLDAEIRHEMKREGIVPNIWVFPDRMLIYVNMVGEHQTSYSQRGPEANSNRENGDSRTTFRGCPVFEAQSFDVDFTGQPIDLMVRERQCGEFFTLAAEEKDSNGNLITPAEDKYIYDANIDNWKLMKHSVCALQAVNIGVSNNDYNDYKKGHDVGGTFHDASDATKALASDLILFRPHQTYRMASAILAKGGSELGSTFHGHHDFLLSDDIIRKIHVGHYTFYSKSVVKRPKNYVIVEDIFSQGYVGGEGTELFPTANKSEEYREAQAQGTLGKGGSKDIIVVAIPPGKAADLATCLDLSGRFHPSVYERFHANVQDQSKEQYPSSASVYGVLNLKNSDPYRVTDNDEFMNRIQRVNTVCFRGCEGVRDNGSFKVTQLNQGHWGENVYPGCKRVRDGENIFLKDCNYQVGL